MWMVIAVATYRRRNHYTIVLCAVFEPNSRLQCDQEIHVGHPLTNFVSRFILFVLLRCAVQQSCMLPATVTRICSAINDLNVPWHWKLATTSWVRPMLRRSWSPTVQVYFVVQHLVWLWVTRSFNRGEDETLVLGGRFWRCALPRRLRSIYETSNLNSSNEQKCIVLLCARRMKLVYTVVTCKIHPCVVGIIPHDAFALNYLGDMTIFQASRDSHYTFNAFGVGSPQTLLGLHPSSCWEICSPDLVRN